jgi:hypothetical protein
MFVRFAAMALAIFLAGAIVAQDKVSQSLTIQVGHTVTLSWTASTSMVAGYNIYISQTTGGPYTKINSGLIAGLTYQDLNAVSGNTYFYVATAVDSSGDESVNSNEVSAVIPNP